MNKNDIETPTKAFEIFGKKINENFQALLERVEELERRLDKLKWLEETKQ